LEGDASLVRCEQAAIGDGDAMGVAREISQDFFRAAEWARAIDHPLCVAQWLQIPSECLRIDEPGMLAEELQLTGAMSGAELVQEHAAEQFREHAQRTDKMPMRAPRCFGSAAMVSMVSDDALNSRS